jgi:hypothetical protein
MSKTNKQPISSSLGALRSPATSAPPSPTMVSISGPEHTSTGSSKHTDTQIIEQKQLQNKIKFIETQSQKQSDDIHEMKQSMSLLLEAIHSLKVDRVPISSTQTHTDTHLYTSSHPDSDSDSVSVNPRPIANKIVASNTMSHREQVKDNTIEATKTLFDLSAAKQNAISNYANSTFDLSDTMIELNETKNENVSSQQNISFISSLLPQSNTSDRTSLAELLQSGIKANSLSTVHKIKDVHKFLELLTEQAKTIVQSDNQSGSGSSDYLLYTLSLMKLLFDYGLNATLDYHFKLMKRIQAKECKITTEQPMLMLDIMSKYKRVSSDKLLHSTLLYTSNTSTGKSSSKSNSNPRSANSKFSGTPCAFHTKQLGHPANHSDEQCRAKQK